MNNFRYNINFHYRVGSPINPVSTCYGDGESKTYSLIDLLWAVPFGIVMGLFISFLIYFYSHFPDQLIWVIIFAPLGLVIGFLIPIDKKI